MEKIYNKHIKTPRLNNLKELLDYSCIQFKEKPVFRYMNKKEEVFISYDKFYNDVISLGAYFINRGFNNTHIALIGENSYNWVVTYFAVINTGNIIVPIDKELSPNDITSLLKRSDSTVLVYSENYFDEVKDNKIELINMANYAKIIKDVKDSIPDFHNIYNSRKINNNTMCAIIFTSGTTAEPKGAMLSHKNIMFGASGMDNLFAPLERTMLVLPLHHMYGFTGEIVYPILNGGSIFINSSLRHLMTEIQIAKPEFMDVVPLMAESIYKKIWEKAKADKKDEILRKLIKLSNFLLNRFHIDLRKKLFATVHETFGGSLKALFIGGAAINPECVTGLHDFGIKPYIGYGATECAPLISSVPENVFSTDSCGKPITGIEVRIVNGEIQVKGDNVFSGYYKDPAATAEAFDGDWYKTGDIGEIKEEFIYITGRLKNLIILSNGENISPEYLESLLTNNIDLINEVVVYDEKQVIVAEIYSEKATDETKKIIKSKIEKINQNLPLFMRINKVKFRNTEFEKTTSKKIKRNTVGGPSND